MRSDDPTALLIGETAYCEAGGRVERDLFSAQNEDRWLDPEIAEQLAATTLEAEAARVATEVGVAWIRPIASENTWEASSKLHRVTVPQRPYTEEEQLRIDEVETRCSAIETEMEDESVTDDAYAALESEYDALIIVAPTIHRTVFPARA
jgi:ParB family chromosome partitioning protein